MLIYTTIQHKFRRSNNLSCNQYILCDMIYHLSNNKNSKIFGWCYMSRQNMGNELGLSKRTIIRLIEEMELAGFLEKDKATKHLRTTQKWDLVYVYDNVAPMVPKSHQGGDKELPQGGDKMLPNNNKIDNNKINIPVWDDFLLYAKTLSIYKEAMEFQLQAKFDSWVENKWRDGNNKPIKNWKTKLRSALPYFKGVGMGPTIESSNRDIPTM